MMSRLLAALALLLACVATGAADAPTTTVIDRATSVASNEPVYPAFAVAAEVSLPDDWSQTHPAYSGGVWYRTMFDSRPGAGPGELSAVYIERACSNVQVHLNGALVFLGGRMREPLTRNCSRPQLVPLPPALLKAQGNALDVRVVGVAVERTAARQGAGGLSRIEVGPLGVLAPRHAARVFASATWIEASSLVLVGLGCVLLAVGWLNRREVYFSYLGSLCLAWVLVSLGSWARELPWSNDVSEFLLCSVWAVLLALAAQFFLSFAGLRSRAIENLMAVQWVVVPLTLIVAGPGRLFDLARVWYVVLALELAFVTGIYLVVTRRQRPQDFGPMTLAVAAGAVALLAELGVQFGAIELPALSVGQVVVPLLLGAVGIRLFLLFASALRRTEEDRDRLAVQLQRLTAEFDDRVEQLTAQRVDQLTERERKRIASDLHDDLGAKLLTIVHTVDGARIPQLAREALEEMRLSVRGLAGKPVRLDEAFADWRAEIMVRLGQAKIDATWRHPEADVAHTLAARVFMQLTRILREAISNVIKHSGATRCDVRCTVDEGTLRLTVRDDGKGIAADLNRGQGMASMKRRAKKMSGQCLVESKPGYGVVISLTVPL